MLNCGCIYSCIYFILLFLNQDFLNENEKCRSPLDQGHPPPKNKGMSYSYFSYETELGEMTLVSDGKAIVTVLFGSGTLPGCFRGEDSILIEAIQELNQYIAGQRKVFSVPVDPLGSDTERKIYFYVRDHVAYGKFITYERIASELDLPLETVEEALHTNSCPIWIPCHRVIGADKKLRTYVGDRLKMKKGLLAFEHQHVNRDFVAPDYHDDDEDSGYKI